MKLKRKDFLVFIFLSFASQRNYVTAECTFPPEWTGEWFQGGRGPLGLISVNKTHFSDASCVEEGKASRYFVYLEKEKCRKCVVIHMKHPNVIHYKESYCDASIDTMELACNLITGDNRLFWMFRWNAEIVPCPFKGPLTFTYRKGWEKECKSPVSQVDSCADDMRLLFRQQACPDVPTSQSKKEELVCLGSWKEEEEHYFVGKINHSHAFTDEDRYRCFMYARSPTHRSFYPTSELELASSSEPVWHLTMSNDAACLSLNSFNDAAKIMKLKKANHGHKKCHFPRWFSKHWSTLDFSHTYFVYRHNTSLKITNGSVSASQNNVEIRGQDDLKIVCHKYFDAEKNHAHSDPKRHGRHGRQVTLIVHFTVGCRSGYRCMKIFRRSSNAVQVQFGQDALTSKEACTDYYWQPKDAKIVTLVSHNENQSSCGPYGKYVVPGVVNSSEICRPDDMLKFSHVNVGCSRDTLELHQICPGQTVSSYQCHGDWESNGITYVIASPLSRPSGAPRRVCFIYTRVHHVADGSPASSASLIMTARHDTCIERRDDAHFTLSATLIDHCAAEASGISSGSLPKMAFSSQSFMGKFMALFFSIYFLLFRDSTLLLS